MLESMISNYRPTRAEISDVANAVFDGTSATMLSGESAVGKYPVETVRTMAVIIKEAERNINYKKRFDSLSVHIRHVTDAVCHACVGAAHDLSAAAIIAITQSGATARMISRFRPGTPIIAATVSPKAYNKLSLSWGVTPVIAEMKDNTDELLVHAMDVAAKTGVVKSNDLVVLVAGVPVGIVGNINIMKIDKIP
ncbi:MAG: pyruvate kinase, partial [Firmicutes bacterium]|nr:pyruvate kinase [Bacillota bacterium]